MYQFTQDMLKDRINLAHERAAKFHLEKIAVDAMVKRPRSKMLVKLAGILISTGEKIKTYAERDLSASRPASLLQDM